MCSVPLGPAYNRATGTFRPSIAVGDVRFLYPFQVPRKSQRTQTKNPIQRSTRLWTATNVFPFPLFSFDSYKVNLFLNKYAGE